MVKFLTGHGAVKAAPPPSGPLLTLKEWAALHQAPRRPGTTVTVFAKPVREVGDRADHMFNLYDDGREQFIVRGGPSAHTIGSMVGLAANGTLYVQGQVDPARQSPDYGASRRVMARGFLPGLSARDAVAPARAHAARVNEAGNHYTQGTNSNSYAADDFETRFGIRVGDDRTPGYRTRLSDKPPTERDYTPAMIPFNY